MFVFARASYVGQDLLLRDVCVPIDRADIVHGHLVERGTMRPSGVDGTRTR